MSVEKATGERGLWVYDKEAGGVLPVQEKPKIKSHHVIEDTMEPMLSHADGKMYDSKSAYKRALKEQGYQVIGNERFGEFTDIPTDEETEKEIREAAAEAERLIKWGMARPKNEREREEWELRKHQKN